MRLRDVGQHGRHSGAELSLGGELLGSHDGPLPGGRIAGELVRADGSVTRPGESDPGIRFGGAVTGGSLV